VSILVPRASAMRKNITILMGSCVWTGCNRSIRIEVLAPVLTENVPKT